MKVETLKMVRRALIVLIWKMKVVMMRRGELWVSLMLWKLLACKKIRKSVRLRIGN